MQIQTKTHINARTQDGRTYAAGEDTISDIDDDDAGMVALAQSLIMSGQAVHYGDAGTVDDDEPPADDPADDTEAEAEAEADTEADDELAQLRADAEAAGVKVDGRWGADRLREEIQAAEAADE